MIQRIHKFALYPFGSYGSGRKDHGKPVAALQRLANFVVPLLRTGDMLFAVPTRDFVASQKAGQVLYKTSIAPGVGKEEFARLRHRSVHR